MNAPLRITRITSKSPDGRQDPFKPYMDRLLKLIPAEVLSLYAVGTGFIDERDLVSSAGWAAFCLMATIWVKAFGTADRRHKLPPDWVHTSISAAAFCVWVYYLGGPFSALEWHSKPHASLLILAFTFIAPYLYRGPWDG